MHHKPTNFSGDPCAVLTAEPQGQVDGLPVRGNRSAGEAEGHQHGRVRQCCGEGLRVGRIRRVAPQKRRIPKPPRVQQGAKGIGRGQQIAVLPGDGFRKLCVVGAVQKPALMQAQTVADHVGLLHQHLHVVIITVFCNGRHNALHTQLAAKGRFRLPIGILRPVGGFVRPSLQDIAAQCHKKRSPLPRGRKDSAPLGQGAGQLRGA